MVEFMMSKMSLCCSSLIMATRREERGPQVANYKEMSVVLYCISLNV